nr:hypothetical protein [Rhodococcus sp. PAMC28707]
MTDHLEYDADTLASEWP